MHALRRLAVLVGTAIAIPAFLFGIAASALCQWGTE
jgi:hypothetical protein